MKMLPLMLTAILMLASVAELSARATYRLHLEGKPESHLVNWSDRALERRARLNIENDSLDLEVSPLYIDQIEAAGLHVVCCSRWLNTVVVTRADGKPMGPQDWPDFSFVTQVDTLTTTQRISAPERNKYEMLDELEMTEAAADDCSSPLEQVNALGPLYEAGFRGQGMLIVVLDAGFKRVNTWDWLMNRVVGERDLYEPIVGSSHLYSADTHGSCCLSIMASPQEHGVWGTAQDATYFLVRTELSKTESSLEEDMWVVGAELADSLGADVISSSLGYNTFDGGLMDHTKADFCQDVVPVSRGAKIACQKGILVCNAAGNYGGGNWNQLFFPADVAEVLTVGGVTPNGRAASFTSHGFLTPYLKPDVSARATHCYVVSDNPNGTADSNGSGTSYSTPLVAGLCASLWSAVPELTPAELRDVVRQSASQYQSPDSIIGYGMPDFGVALELAQLLHPSPIEPIKADEAFAAHTGIYDYLGRKVDREGLPSRGLILVNGKKKRYLP